MTAPATDFATARRAMIDSQLRPQGVTNIAVLAAMAAIPREAFVPEAAANAAYTDRSISVDGKGAMMPPAPLARLLTAAEPRAGERALVVGAAPAYAAELLRYIGLLVSEDLAAGPFDLILIEGAVEIVPDALTTTIVEGGRIATALIENGVTRLAIGGKLAGVIGWNRFADSEIVPLPCYSRPPVFTF
jgi:protein-L-isoaspartate(D-aspartate) O-methyltransferase